MKIWKKVLARFLFSIRNVCMYVKKMSFTRQGVNLFTFDI